MHTYFHNRRMELFRHLPVVIYGLLRNIRGNVSKLLDVDCWDVSIPNPYRNRDLAPVAGIQSHANLADEKDGLKSSRLGAEHEIASGTNNVLEMMRALIS